MRIIDLALKDLLQVVRDKKSALFLIVMPLAFTFFFGWVFGGTENAEDPRLPVGVVFAADEALGNQLVALLDNSDAIRTVPLGEVSEDEAAGQVADGTLAAALLVPAGWSEQTMAGASPALTLVMDSGSQAGYSVQNAVAAINNRLRGAAEMARFSVDTLQLENPADQAAAFEAAFTQAMETWQSPPLSIQSEMAIIPHPKYGTSGFNAYSQASPGMIVQFAIYGIIQSAMVLVLERKTGALQRLLTTPISRLGVITGHVMAMFVVAAVQILLLVAVGVLAFDVPYMHDPAATLLMIVSLALCSASLGLLIGAISKEEGQVIMYSLLAMMVLSAMGGAWFPLDVSGETFSTIGHFLPTAWAMDGLQNIIVRGQGLASVLQPAGILLGYTAAFFALAVWRFKFE